MKTVFIILALLIAAEWKKKEACTFKRHPWKKLKNDDALAATTSIGLGHNDQPNSPDDHMDIEPYTIGDPEDDDMASTEKIVDTCHVLIIGAGAQTVGLLNHLVQWTRKEQLLRTLPEPENPVHIFVVEEKSKLGPGKPYDGDEVNPEHLTYNFLLAQHSMVQNDFANWVLERQDLYEFDHGTEEQLELPPPRSAVGHYLQEGFEELEDECKELFVIKSLNGTSAVRVSRGDGVFVVELSDGIEVHTTDIVLATGHWDSSLFGKDTTPKGFFPSPWPASALTHPRTGIPADAKVGILGSGRNAIDAAMTLAHEHGTFADKIPTDEDPEPGYTYTPKSTQFQIAMYSRRGHLPGVTGRINPNFLYDEIEEIAGNATLSLDELMAVLRKDLARLTREINPEESKTAKEFLETEVENIMYKRKLPRERLEDDIKRARDSWQKNKVLPVQSFFASVYVHLNTYLARFSPKDTFTFETEIVPRILNYARPIPLVTAEKLLAMMKANCLIVVVAGPKIEVVRGTNHEGVVVKGKRYKRFNMPHRYFIDATEQSGDVKRNPSPLVQSLFENKFIQPNYLDLHPLPNDNQRIEEVDTTLRDETTNKIQKITKKFYRSNGIKMDTEKMRVIPPDDADELPGVIYATGPFAYGQVAFSDTLPYVSEFGDHIAYDIVHRRFETYSKRYLAPIQDVPETSEGK